MRHLSKNLEINNGHNYLANVQIQDISKLLTACSWNQASCPSSSRNICPAVILTRPVDTTPEPTEFRHRRYLTANLSYDTGLAQVLPPLMSLSCWPFTSTKSSPNTWKQHDSMPLNPIPGFQGAGYPFSINVAYNLHPSWARRAFLL